MSQSPLARLWAHAIDALSRLRATLLPLDTLLAAEVRALRATLGALEAFCRRIALTEAIALARAFVERCAPRRHERVTQSKPAKPPPRLRLWPARRRAAACVTLLGRPTNMRELWRNQRRDALIARLRHARRKPTYLRLADRIDALQRLLDAPRTALRRFARKLRSTPKLGLHLAARRLRASPLLHPERISECEALCWSALTDSS